MTPDDWRRVAIPCAPGYNNCAEDVPQFVLSYNEPDDRLSITAVDSNNNPIAGFFDDLEQINYEGSNGTGAVVSGFVIFGESITVYGIAALVNAPTDLTQLDFFAAGPTLLGTWTGLQSIQAVPVGDLTIYESYVQWFGPDRFYVSSDGDVNLAVVAEVRADFSGGPSNVDLSTYTDVFTFAPDLVIDSAIELERAVNAVMLDGKTLTEMRFYDGSSNLLGTWTGSLVVHRVAKAGLLGNTFFAGSPAPGEFEIYGINLDTVDYVRTHPNPFPSSSGGQFLAFNPDGPNAAENISVIGGRTATILEWSADRIHVSLGYGPEIEIEGIELANPNYVIPFQVGDAGGGVNDFTIAESAPAVPLIENVVPTVQPGGFLIGGTALDQVGAVNYLTDEGSGSFLITDPEIVAVYASEIEVADPDASGQNLTTVQIIGPAPDYALLQSYDLPAPFILN